MNYKIVKKCIDKNELQLSFRDAVTHYWICFFLLIIPITTIVAKIIGKPNRVGEVYLIVIPVLLSILFGILQNRRLRFKEIITRLDREALNKIIEDTAKELAWTIDRNNKSYVKAHTNPHFLSGSWENK